MKIAFIPISVLGGLLAGFIGQKAFDAIWGKVDEQEPPQPEHREISLAKLAIALAHRGRHLPTRQGALRPRFAARLCAVDRNLAWGGAPRAGVAVHGGGRHGSGTRGAGALWQRWRRPRRAPGTGLCPQGGRAQDRALADAEADGAGVPGGQPDRLGRDPHLLRPARSFPRPDRARLDRRTGRQPGIHHQHAHGHRHQTRSGLGRNDVRGTDQTGDGEPRHRRLRPDREHPCRPLVCFWLFGRLHSGVERDL